MSVPGRQPCAPTPTHDVGSQAIHNVFSGLIKLLYVALACLLIRKQFHKFPITESGTHCTNPASPVTRIPYDKRDPIFFVFEMGTCGSKQDAYETGPSPRTNDPAYNQYAQQQYVQQQKAKKKDKKKKAGIAAAIIGASA